MIGRENRMGNSVKWVTLVAGVMILLYSGFSLVRMAALMNEYGGLWSWDFVLHHPIRFGLPVAGLALLGTGLVLFVRDGR